MRSVQGVVGGQCLLSLTEQLGANSFCACSAYTALGHKNLIWLLKLFVERQVVVCALLIVYGFNGCLCGVPPNGRFDPPNLHQLEMVMFVRVCVL